VTRADCLSLFPLILIAGTSMLVMVAIAFRRHHTLTAGLTIAGLVIAFMSILAMTPYVPRRATALLIMDHYALFYMGVIIASALAVAVLSYQYFEQQEGHHEELYVLLLLATLGCAVLVASSHSMSFFLGLEILSVSLYAMIAYLKERKQSLEAGMKYLVLAGSSSAFLLFGMALVYADLGTMEFSRVAAASAVTSHLAFLIPGIVLIITGIGFKLAVAPFHLWTPDVYEGAPAPVTAFIATASKTAIFALLLRFFYHSGLHQYRAVYVVFVIIAVASMIAGNLLALWQTNVKRILAYSSIAHFGYMLVAFTAGGHMAVEAVTFYLVAYTVTTLGAFGVVTVLSNSSRDADRLDDYQGLFWRRPLIAGIFTVMLLSLAGIPATMGFLAKFYVLAAGASIMQWSLIIILVMTSAIGLFYYLRIIVTLYSASSEREASTQPVVLASGFVLALLTALLIWFGVYPAPLLEMIQRNAVLSVAKLLPSESDKLSRHFGSRGVPFRPTAKLDFGAGVEDTSSDRGFELCYDRTPGTGVARVSVTSTQGRTYGERKDLCGRQESPFVLPLTYMRAQGPDATAVVYPLDHFVCLEDRFVKTLRQTGLMADLLKDRADLLGAALDNADVAYGRIQPMGCAERYIAGAENLPNDTGKTGHGIPYDLKGEIHDEARIDLRGELY
jgi:NADH-quinone oxidoreductase subunit N